MAFWYLVSDDTRLNLDHVRRYIEGLQATARDVSERLPNARMDYAPLDELVVSQQRKATLARILVGFSAPLLCILMLFIGSVAILLAHFQEGENAVLVSRGASRVQFAVLIAAETLATLVVACPAGVFLSLWIARLLGYSAGFLAFAERQALQTHLSSVDWRYVGVSAAVCMACRLVPAWLASRAGIVAHEQRRARHHRSLTMFRVLGIALLLLVVAYTYRQVAVSGTLATTWADGESGPWRDPLVFLAPTLFLFTAPLVLTELFQVFILPLMVFGKAMRGVPVYLCALSLGRGGGQYSAPTYLLILCLGFGVFFLSLAKSADTWLADRLHYQMGADLTFESKLADSAGDSLVPSTGSDRMVLLPVAQYHALSGVLYATRVGDYAARLTQGSLAGRNLRAIGVDRAGLGQVVHYRHDFTPSLGELTNQLASRSNAVILPSEMGPLLQLGEGDTFPVMVCLDGGWGTLRLSVVGFYDWFPTVYAKETPAILFNLDYLTNEFGVEPPYRVWLRLDPDTTWLQIHDALEDMGVQATNVGDLRGTLALDQQRLERVGLFGLMSVGFLSGALLAGAGLLLYHFASLSGRMERFALLRALGMQRNQVLAMVSLEYVITMLYGIVMGVGEGMAGAMLYIPFFPLTDGPVRPVPPFLPLVDWGKAGWMALAMGVTLMLIEAVLLYRIARARAFQILRMGVRP